ncbi:MAG: rhodanese-like domain-containing protein [Vicinamibacteria bacterium]|nr:rhodanese-like domain-containing protein [Vicinamibacteria bacterium]
MTIRDRWSRLSLNQELAAGALALGFLALFARPYRSDVVPLDVRELAALIEEEKDHVDVGDLAAWIVEGRSDYRLIDLRSEDEYAAYHIPTAENIVLSALPDAGLSPNEKIVLYSDGGIHAYQAWMLMRAKGFRTIYTMKGGLDEWKAAVLFPTMAENAPAAERARFERAAAMSRFFGGTPRTGGAGTATLQTPEMPKVEAPAGGAVLTKPKKKKKEGC